MSDEDLFAGLVVAASVVEAAQGFDGADDAVGGGFYTLSLLDEVAKGMLGLQVAALEKAEGVGVAVNRNAAAEIEFVGDRTGTRPVKEGLVDGVAFGMVANGAASGVMDEGVVAFVGDFRCLGWMEADRLFPGSRAFGAPTLGWVGDLRG